MKTLHTIQQPIVSQASDTAYQNLSLICRSSTCTNTNPTSGEASYEPVKMAAKAFDCNARPKFLKFKLCGEIQKLKQGTENPWYSK